jgi:hypothetical protein
MFIGPDSAKSNVSQQAGRVYRATDTQVEYYSNGTNWVKFGVGSTQERVPQVSADVVHDKSDADRYVYVESGSGEYVATGPTGEVNRFSSSGVDAIQAAIDDLPSGGGRVHVEAGDYPIVTPDYDNDIGITIDKDDVMLTGDGKATRIFLPDNTTNQSQGKKILEVGGTSDNPRFSSPTPVNGCTVKDIYIDGNHPNQGTISNADDGHNIEILGADNHFENIWSWFSTGDGIEITDYGSTRTNERNKIVDCNFRQNFEQNVHLHGAQRTLVSDCLLDGEKNNGNISLVAKNGSGGENIDVKVSDCLIINGDKAGVEVVQGNDTNYNENIIFDGCVIKNNKFGVLIDWGDVGSIKFRDCDIQNNDQDGIINAGGGVQNTEIVGCTIENNGEHGISLTNSDGPITSVSIDNTTIKDNNTKNNDSHGIFIKYVPGGDPIKNLTIQNTDIVSTGTPEHRDGISLDDRDGSPTVTDSYLNDVRVSGVKRFEVNNQLNIPSNSIRRGDVTVSEPDRLAAKQSIALRNIRREGRGTQLNIDPNTSENEIVYNLQMNGNDVKLPPAGDVDGRMYIIGSRDLAGGFTVEDNSNTSLVTLSNQDVAICISDGTGWIVSKTAGAVT